MILNLPPKSPAGKDDVAYWDDFLDEADINKILSLTNWHKSKNGEVGSGMGGVYAPEVRTSQVSWMDVNSETADIWNKISQVVTEVNRTWFHYDLTGFYEPAQLTLYHGSEQGHYKWHCDNSVSDSNVPRKLSMSFMLSDKHEFEGGDLQIMNTSDAPVTLEQKKGRAWFFPSYTLHRVTPVTRGIRRTLVLWVGGPAFK
jgi:PKHD-type hydroxylase